MRPTPFNPASDFAPIPFSASICKEALNIKEAGLAWTPHAGCFVWDRENRIEAASPFPLDIYFILNLNRFLEIFGTEEEIQRSLVWLPTVSQALSLLRRARPEEFRFPVMDPEELLLELYRRLLDHLRD